MPIPEERTVGLRFNPGLEDVGDDADGLMALLGGENEEYDDADKIQRFINGGTYNDPDDVEFEQDPEPGYEKPSFEDRVIPDFTTTTVASKRVTQAIRKDVKGKVAMFLTVAGATWAGRDPVCGQTLVQAIPDQEDEDGVSAGIATALTDIICDSPDVVKWFTSSGKYMKWLTLAMAVQPVLTTAFHHHVTHAISNEPQEPEDWSGYATH